MKLLVQIFLVVLSFIFLFSCKKESKKAEPNTATNNTNSQSSLTLTAFPNNTGNSWAYYETYTTQVYDGNSNTTTTYTGTGTYTIQILNDSILSGNIAAKNWTVTFNNSFSNYPKLAYNDSSSGLFYVRPYPYASFEYSLALKFPLTLNKSWVISGLPQNDTCKVTSQDNFILNNASYPVLVVERTTLPFYYSQYKISAKGVMYYKTQVIDVINTQITTTYREHTLINCNF